MYEIIFFRWPIVLHRVSKRTVGVDFLLGAPAMLDFPVLAFATIHVPTIDLRRSTSILLIAYARYPVSMESSRTELNIDLYCTRRRPRHTLLLQYPDTPRRTLSYVLIFSNDLRLRHSC